MDEKTKHIVASNLAMTYLKKQRKTVPKAEAVPIFEYYQQFLQLLEQDEAMAGHYQNQREKMTRKLA